MRINSLHIERFRSIAELDISFEPGITTLFGENSTGKSSALLALSRLVSQLLAAGTDIVDQKDYPYGITGGDELVINAEIELSPSEHASLCSDFFSAANWPQDRMNMTFGVGERSINLLLHRPDNSNVPLLKWGRLTIRGQVVSIGEEQEGSSQAEWEDVLGDDNALAAIIEGAKRGYGPYTLRFYGGQTIVKTLQDSFKEFVDFRTRPIQGQRTDALESFSGSEIPSTLLNLRNHTDPGMRSRYDKIVQAFHQFFPRYEIVATEDMPGSTTPEIQFYEANREKPLPIDLISSGVYQMLIMLTNLIAREGLIIIVEHPESHLHPHAMRALYSSLLEASERNQIIVITHDSHFVDPSRPNSIRKISWNADTGTQVHSLANVTSPRELGQIQTSLRSLDQRDMLFARAVILVEGDTELGFLPAVASTLERNLNANSISVVSVDGQTNFPHYFPLLDNLRIPYVCLKDEPWGDGEKYPPDRFFSLDLGPKQGIEDYLDQQGLGELREQVKKEVGTSKRRVGAPLGARLERNQIPSVFDDVLKAAIDLVT